MIDTRTEDRFALCIQSQDCEDLIARKVYRVLPDEASESAGYLRILDESGEDYLYPASYFVFVRLPRKAREALEVGT